MTAEMALTLSAHKYCISYRHGEMLANADGLRRLVTGNTLESVCSK